MLCRIFKTKRPAGSPTGLIIFLININVLSHLQLFTGKIRHHQYLFVFIISVDSVFKETNYFLKSLKMLYFFASPPPVPLSRGSGGGYFVWQLRFVQEISPSPPGEGPDSYRNVVR